MIYIKKKKNKIRFRIIIIFFYLIKEKKFLHLTNKLLIF